MCCRSLSGLFCNVTDWQQILSWKCQHKQHHEILTTHLNLVHQFTCFLWDLKYTDTLISVNTHLFLWYYTGKSNHQLLVLNVALPSGFGLEGCSVIYKLSLLLTFWTESPQQCRGVGSISFIFVTLTKEQGSLWAAQFVTVKNSVIQNIWVKYFISFHGQILFEQFDIF